MRLNQPVSSHEVELGADQWLVSRTDLKGRIDYVNRDFVEVSGFSAEELIGQPHNIVRHPDMPAAAFADLWTTLKAGRPWTGLVKNRCKNGDFYWVEAHATPVWQSGSVTGYMSVRRRPTRAAVAAAEKLYRVLSSGASGGWRLQAGRPYRFWSGEAAVRIWDRAGEWIPFFVLGVLPGLAALLTLMVLAATRLEGTTATLSLWVAAALALALATTVGQRLGQTRRLLQLRALLLGISEGQVSHPIDVTRNDTVGHLAQAIETVQVRLGFELADTRAAREEATAVRVALDCASTNIMMADGDGIIRYANPAVLEMLRHAEADLRSHLPSFRADTVLGSNIDAFHRRPSFQRDLLKRLTAPHRATLNLGGRRFGLMATPVLSPEGRRLGTVVEWADRTQEMVIERNVTSAIAAATRGEFGQRVELKDEEGFVLALAHSVNDLLGLTQRVFQETAAAVSSLAAGNLVHRMQGQYEGLFAQLRDDVNVSIDRLAEVVTDIRHVSTQLATTTAEIASGNQDLSSRTEEQAASLEETAASMEQLTGTARQNLDRAREAGRLAQVVTDTAAKGQAAMDLATVAMERISQSSKEIAQITSVIDGIAFQTNILSLNAAVEAARAGAQGRGFAVVASEVRALAAKAAEAAAHINVLIRDSVGQIAHGSEQVTATSATFAAATQSIHSLAGVVHEIAASSEEQTRGIEQVNHAIAQMDQVTQQNAALVEEAAAAALAMDEQSQRLVQSVALFQVEERRSGPILVAGTHASDRSPAALSGPRALAALAPAALASDVIAGPRIREP